MGLRFPPRSPPPSRPARGRSEPEPHHTDLDLVSYPSASRANLPSMVTNFDRTSLVETNARSEDSCLIVVSNKVYDLTVWLDDQDVSLARHELRRLLITDPVRAGYWLAERFEGQLEDLIGEYRIGDFVRFEATSTYLDHGGGLSGPANMVENSVNSSSSGTLDRMNPASPPTGAASSLQPQRPSHLNRALALVEFHQRRVIEAETKVGTAHVSLADAFAGLAEAVKKRDHLVMLACEGCRPTLPEWEDFGDDQMGQGYASGSV